MPAKEISLPTNETAVVNTTVYSLKDFPLYNPDELVRRKGGLHIYERMMTDEQVKVVVRFRRDAVTGRDYTFKIEGDQISDEEKEKRIALYNKIVSRVQGSFKSKLDCIMTSMQNGYSITEKTFEPFEYDGLTWWGIKHLRKKPADSFQFYTDDYGNVNKFTQSVNGKEIKLNYNKFIHHIHNQDNDLLYGKSELREAYRSWFSKDIIIKFQNIHLERHGSGFTWLQPTGEKTLVKGSQTWTLLQDVLENLQVGTGAILPPNVDLNIEHPATTDAFEKAIAQHDKAISKSLLMPNLLGLSEQGQTGSYSQSQTQLEAFLWLLDAEAKALEETLNEQLFKQLGEVNFGDDNYPHIEFLPLSQSMKMLVINTWKDLVTAGAVTKSDTDEDHLRDMLDFPERSEKDDQGEDVGDEGDSEDGGNVKPDSDKNDQLPDETIIGLPAKASAFAAAQKRVAFAVIEKQSEDIVEEYASEVSKVFATLVDDVVATIKEKKLGTIEGDIADVKKLKFNSRGLTKLKNTAKKVLRDSWKVGGRHAKDEVDKAKKETFQADFARIEDLQNDFFEARSFTMAGKLTGDAMANINNILAQGVKGSKTTDEIVKQIYTEFGEAGMLDPADVTDALGEAIDVENPTSRLKTWVRTNSFEAINESRYAYFTDPQLDGFVEALEYSAILDSRTTNICKHLDGQIHAANSDVWDTYRPPNHFNCRSILIPVTEIDDWDESDDPSIEPQKGFK